MIHRLDTDDFNVIYTIGLYIIIIIIIIIIYHHQSSPSIIINHHQSSSIIINHHQSSSIIINHQSSIINHQSSIINHQSSIINHILYIARVMPFVCLTMMLQDSVSRRMVGDSVAEAASDEAVFAREARKPDAAGGHAPLCSSVRPIESHAITPSTPFSAIIPFNVASS
jgi:hypothetical protein